jgi:hypothetical protein
MWALCADGVTFALFETVISCARGATEVSLRCLHAPL